MNNVYLKKCATYEQETVDGAVEFIFQSSSICASITAKTRIVLKLNLLIKSSPDEAVTTHPAVVAAVIKALKKRGAEQIVLADSSSGFFSAAKLKGIYEKCGIANLVQSGVTLNYDVSSAPRSGDGLNKQFEIINAVTNADVVIGIGKVKTHAMTGMSGAIKNYFGVIPGLAKAEMHSRIPEKPQFCEMLCELYDLVKPSFSIMDGVVGMEGNGPSGGTPRPFGFIIGGENAYMVDRVLCDIMGIGAQKALTVAASIKRGSAPANIAEIAVVGDRDIVDMPITDLLLPESADNDFTSSLPEFLKPIGKKLIRSVSPRPVIRTKDCVGCAMCFEICPQHTIKIENKIAHIEQKNCIKCFCCHEVCPQRAIDIKTNILFRVFK
ncbi:MAG: DUF362 domain-containing protein [Oscillospiraceae bacterium]